jgi:hypothetical protein
VPYGEAELVITIQAKFAILARTMAPELFGDAMALMNRLLPRAAGAEGDTPQPGRVCGLASASSKTLTLMYAAAQRNNEL